MHPIPATDVYFTVDGQGAVTAIKINEGEIIQRRVFSESRLPPAWVNTLHEMIASMDTNPIESRSISFLQQHGSHTLGFDQTCFAPSDMGHRPSGAYMDQLLGAYPDPTLPLEAEARIAESGVVFPFDIPGLSDLWDLPDGFDLSCVPALPENSPIDQVPGGSNTQEPGAGIGSESRPMGLKRAQKLHRMLGALENHRVASKEDHNRQIEALYNGSQLFPCSQDVSMVQFAAILGKHSSVSSAVGTIYGLLSWNIFGMEEDRLVKKDRLSPYIAAKQVRSIATLVTPSIELADPQYCHTDESKDDKCAPPSWEVERLGE
ncbi:hypothetical protein N7472_006821 [Penicillium cf. griseofulvum]|uniref:Uncharacterized protein n=1 Tax=Penicillium cf. griseofulvum TaxID=2972120 RepID=A0A9W9JG73_9EURO|nr:hypothetical protein N7472_006821 [Penicillium cf. griseofulvum]